MSAALAGISRMDSISTSYRLGEGARMAAVMAPTKGSLWKVRSLIVKALLKVACGSAQHSASARLAGKQAPDSRDDSISFSLLALLSLYSPSVSVYLTVFLDPPFL